MKSWLHEPSKRELETVSSAQNTTDQGQLDLICLALHWRSLLLTILTRQSRDYLFCLVTITNKRNHMGAIGLQEA